MNSANTQQITKYSPSDKVVQSNAVSSASYDWSLVEKKIFCIILNQIHQMEILTRKQQQTILTHKDLMLTFDSNVLLRAINHITIAYKALKGFVGRVIEIKTSNKWIAVGILCYAEHNKDKHTIEIEISRKILPHVLHLSREFTQYNLSTMLNFASTYSQRFYELCMQYENRGFFYFSIDEMRKMFGLEKRYVKYADLIKKVVEKPRQELQQNYQNGNIDFFFKWSPDTYSMKGKKITTLNFSVINPAKISRNYPELLYQIRCELFEVFRSRTIMDSVDWWLTYNNFEAENLLNRIVELKDVYSTHSDIKNIIETVLTNEFQIEV